MKKKIICLFVIFLTLLCCSDKSKQKGDVIAIINDFHLSIDEFEQQLAAELEFDKEFKITQKAKKEFLDELIKKELLIQEAKKLKLDRKKKFIQAIERYWESTLIRDLIDLKGAEIDKHTLVSQEEILDHYNEIKKETPTLPPLNKIQKNIHDELKEKKKRLKLKQWITELKKNAKIKTHENLL